MPWGFAWAINIDRMRNNLIGLFIVLLLHGCGGGGTDPIPKPATDISQFTGTWRYANPTYELCYPTYSGSTFVYALKYGPVIKTNRYQQVAYFFYSDANCSTQMGTIEDLCELTWSVATSELDLTNSVKVTCTNYTRTFIGTTPQDPISPSYVYKDLWQQRDNHIYVGDFTGPLDPDGYPTQLQSSYTYTK
jgi:hypothetical protein